MAKWEGETYAVGYYDVALAMLARKSDLDAAGVRVATIEKPWTKDEFQDALTKLKALGKWEYPLDMGTAGTGEWLPYAYSPLLQSFGGDLINRDGFQSADGALNGDEAVEWAKWFRGLADQGFMATKSGKDSTQDFLNNKSGLLYTGSWAADKARAALGDDLVVMPTVDLGQRAQDRRRLLAVGCHQRLRQFRSRDGLPFLLPEAGKRGRGCQGHRNHPGHGRSRGAASRRSPRAAPTGSSWTSPASTR